MSVRVCMSRSITNTVHTHTQINECGLKMATSLPHTLQRYARQAMNGYECHRHGIKHRSLERGGRDSTDKQAPPHALQQSKNITDLHASYANYRTCTLNSAYPGSEILTCISLMEV